MKKQDIDTFFTRLKEIDPIPKSDLIYKNDFTLLVAVVLSAQSTDAGVNKATKDLFEIADTPKAMYDLGIEGIKNYIKTIGLYNSKAKNVHALCRQLIDLHNSEIPQTREELQALPGVGRKTANVVLNIAFGHPTMAVDTHILRVGNRTGMGKGKTPEQVETNLVKNIPAKYMDYAHHWLILHGRYTCKARKPLCSSCIVKDICSYKDKTPD